MVLSYYLIKPVYTLTWHLLKLFRKKRITVLYCDDVFDVTLFKNVQYHLRPIPCVARNRTVAEAIEAAGHRCTVMPSFPDTVIMFRNMAWKFPCKKIIKFGFEHGAYNFKRFSKAHYYNLFTTFFMTSSHDVSRVEKLGVTTAEAIGFPKIDAAFNGSITPEALSHLSRDLNLDPNKKTILFSATWDGSGMSAVHLWYERVQELTAQYNVLTTLHPWASSHYRATLSSNPALHYIYDHELLRYIMIADCCIGDTNSLIAEFCLLDKPIITFKLPPTPRTMTDVIELIESISVRVTTFDELPSALEESLHESSERGKERKRAARLFFDEADGYSGKRAAEKIIGYLPELKP